MKTITRPTITQLIDAPIGSRLLIWSDKTENPDRVAVKVSIATNGMDKWVGCGKDRSSSEFQLTTRYKTKLEITEGN